jgi:hypothetical protein
MELVMVGVFVFFLCLETFFQDERRGWREKIRLDLKNCNETWSIYTAKQLARESLANNMGGIVRYICDKMLVWSNPKGGIWFADE